MTKFNPIYLIKDDIEDVSSFLDLDYDYCKERIIDYDSVEMAEAWKKANLKTADDILNFYANIEYYIFELMQASASAERERLHGKIVNYLMDCYPAEFYPNMLDYGAGIGTEVLKFAKKGYKVSFTDIPGKTSEFLIHRLKRRNLNAEFVPVGKYKPILKMNFDIIICFDVLEHLINPLETLLFLAQHLSREGVIALVNCPYDEGEHPCHLPRTFPILGRLWAQTLDYVGLLHVNGCDHVYRRAVFWKRLLKRFRYIIWRITTLYVVRIPKK